MGTCPEQPPLSDSWQCLMPSSLRATLAQQSSWRPSVSHRPPCSSPCSCLKGSWHILGVPLVTLHGRPLHPMSQMPLTWLPPWSLSKSQQSQVPPAVRICWRAVLCWRAVPTPASKTGFSQIHIRAINTLPGATFWKGRRLF